MCPQPQGQVRSDGSDVAPAGSQPFVTRHASVWSQASNGSTLVLDASPCERQQSPCLPLTCVPLAPSSVPQPSHGPRGSPVSPSCPAGSNVPPAAASRTNTSTPSSTTSTPASPAAPRAAMGTVAPGHPAAPIRPGEPPRPPMHEGHLAFLPLRPHHGPLLVPFLGLADGNGH